MTSAIIFGNVVIPSFCIVAPEHRVCRSKTSAKTTRKQCGGTILPLTPTAPTVGIFSAKT